MRRTGFALRPFSPTGLPPDIGITGHIGRQGSKLSIRYELRGPMSHISLPAVAEIPGRRERLWEETCLELFLGPAHSERYCEFNLSPSGDWNVYSFTSYRRGMQEERAFEALPFLVEIRPDSLALFFDADLSVIAGDAERLEAGVAAVVKTADGALTYWALAHHGPKPDFHRRDGFSIEL